MSTTSPGLAQRGKRRVQAGAGLVAGGLALLAGCQLAENPDPVPAADRVRAASRPAAAPALIAVLPGSDAADVRPDQPVVVRATAGRLERVTVIDGQGQALAGRLGDQNTAWTSTGPLEYGTTYTVTARALNPDSKATETTSRFTTLRPTEMVGVDRVTPDAGDTVGVGMPIIVDFDRPVRDRAAVERALQVTASRPVPGSWNWVDDDELRYRPARYWPAYTTVTVKLDLRGIEVNQGEWGERHKDLTFRVGPAVISTVDAGSLRMTVARDGKVVRTIRVTTGKRGYATRSGIKVISERRRNMTMDAASTGVPRSSPEYYRLKVAYAMRITNSGEFVHSAPWSVRSHGRRRVSHGCVGMSTRHARWFYQNTNIGDVVKVINTGRRQNLGNGWTDWNVPWERWRAGSAL